MVGPRVLGTRLHGRTLYSQPTTRAPLVYSPEYSVAGWPQAHRFVMDKFRDLARVLKTDGYLDGEHVFVPDDPPDQWLHLVHDPKYVRSFCRGQLDEGVMRRIGFRDLWSPSLVRRTRLEVGGTVLAAKLALERGIACNLGGGTHHAHRDFGSGFTIFNDQAVAAAFLLDSGLIDRALICDLDVHQGDGTAAIFFGQPDVFTLSIHGQSSFPFRKMTSDLDIGLEDGVGDDCYLDVLRSTLPGKLDTFRPDIVFYDAGIDPHVDDELGRMCLTDDGLWARDTFVLEQCVRRGIPVACVIGGGYHRDHMVLARRHSIIHRAAQSTWERLVNAKTSQAI